MQAVKKGVDPRQLQLKNMIYSKQISENISAPCAQRDFVERINLLQQQRTRVMQQQELNTIFATQRSAMQKLSQFPLLFAGASQPVEGPKVLQYGIPGEEM